MVKKSLANAGDGGLIPGSGRSSGGGNGKLLQYPCLENFMDRGASMGLQSQIDWACARIYTQIHFYTFPIKLSLIEANSNLFSFANAHR